MNDDGVWLYREDWSYWWRLCYVENRRVTGPWISDSLPLDALDGHWRKPNERELEMARKDESGRLLEAG